MNIDITASVKPEYPVVDRNPSFTKVVGNLNTLVYLHFVTLTGVSVNVGYLSGMKPGLKGPSMVTRGLIRLMGGFMYAYQNSTGLWDFSLMRVRSVITRKVVSQLDFFLSPLFPFFVINVYVKYILDISGC
ncbi:hypothetical protein DITRI_Ditri02bG0001200 [Diplodiscus trichospermus]